MFTVKEVSILNTTLNWIGWPLYLFDFQLLLGNVIMTYNIIFILKISQILVGLW